MAARLSEQYRLKTESTIVEYKMLVGDYENFAGNFAEYDAQHKKIDEFFAAN
jgi:hypothetical protein